MRVLENNFNNPERQIETTCPFCNSKLEYQNGDVLYTPDGREYIICPCCGENIYLNDGEKEINSDHYTFPDDFWHFSKDDHAVPMGNEWVQKAIEECIQHIRDCTDPDEAWYWEIGTGDTFVIVQRHEDDESYMVIVAKDHYELELPFTSKDYC